MPVSMFEKIIEQIKPCSVTFNGLGEQLLDKGFNNKIGVLKTHKCNINLTTNFSIADAATLEFLVNSEIDLISISLDAPDPEHYQKFRGRPVFDRIIENINRLNQFKENLNTRLPALRLSFVVHKSSIRLMDDFVTLAKELKAEAVLFQPVDLPYNPEKRPSLAPDNLEELRDRFLSTRLRCRRLNVISNLDHLLRHFQDYQTKFFSSGNPLLSKVCANPWFSTYIQVDGTVTPCCSIVGEEYVIGNINDSHFQDIWNNERYMNFRKLIREKKRPVRACKTCVPFTLSDIAEKVKWTPDFLFSYRK